MNKSLKVVSSVALAGMLAINVLNPITLAKSVDDRYDTRLAGTYKGMAQFVLANKNDYVTYREIANSDKFTNVESFKGAGVPSNDNELAQTGDKFVADGKEYTVVVYGGVDKSSDRLTQDDALKILKHFTGSSKMTNAAELEAANVDRTNDRITQDDALQVLKYFTGSTSTLIKGNLPHDEIGDEEDQNFTIEMTTDYINNQSLTSGPDFKIKITNPLETRKTGLKLQIEGLDINGNKITLVGANTITIDANSVSTSAVSFGSTPKDTNNGNKTLNDCVNGTLKVTLLESDGTTVIRTTTVEKRAADTNIANIKTNRLNSIEAEISFEGMGEYDVKNVYYTLDGTTPDTDCEKIEVTGNKVTNKKIDLPISGAGTSTNYTFTYLVEDIYGNQSDGTDTATILTPEDQAKQQDKVKVTLDTAVTNKVKFNVKTLDGTADNTEDLKYVLYKNGKIIANGDVTSDQEKIEIASGSLDGVGTYKISVIVVGDTTKPADSEATDVEFEVKQLPSISNITIAKDENNKLKIDWSKSSDEENCNGYTITIYEVDANGEATIAKTVTTNANAAINPAVNVTSDNTYVFGASSGNLAENKAYIAKITANAGNVFYTNSEETTSNQLFVLSASDLAITNVGTPTAGVINDTDITPNTIKLSVTSGKTALPGVKYMVNVYKDNGASDLAIRYTDKKSKEYTINSDGDIIVDTYLQPGQKYGIELEEVIGDVVNKTAIIPVTTKVAAPVVNGLTVAQYVADTESSAYTNKIAVDSNDIYINGVKYTLGGDYNTELTNIKTIVSQLVAGDKLTIDNDIVTIILKDNKNKALSFGTALDGKKVVISDPTKSEKTITATAPTKMTLQGTNALYNVEAVGSEVEVDSGVIKLTTDGANQNVTLNPNCNVAINGLTVSNTAKTKLVVADANTANVTANTETNTLGFTTNGALALTITGLANLTSVQNGAININAAGNVSVTASNVNVQAQINVTTSAGTVNLTNTTLNGIKKITVSNNGTVTYTYTSDTPIALTNLALRNYTNEELIYDNSDPQNVVGISGVTESNVEEVKDFIDLMRSIVTNNNAKITTTGNNANVIITLNN